MKSEIFLGIDGGGTKTDFVLKKDEDFYKTKMNTIHLKQIGETEFTDTITSGIKNVCRQAEISVDDISYAFAAIPGFGHYPEIEEIAKIHFNDIFKNGNYDLGNDCVVGWAGSLNAEPGVNLVLGTGAIAYGVDPTGTEASSSGWGPVIGDDGSGHDIGMKLLNLFTKMSDGRLERSPLYDAIKDYFNLTTDLEIIEIADSLQRNEVAELAPLLQKGIEKEDRNAFNILDDIAEEAAMAIDAVIRKLSFDPPVDVSYSGGVFHLGKPLLERIKQASKHEINLKEPLHGPEIGALIMAEKLYRSEDR